MDSKTIDKLASLDPAAISPGITAAQSWDPAGKTVLHEGAADQFLSTYGRPNFGWYIATQFANNCLPFPMPMVGRDAWVYRAYMLQLNPRKNFNKHIAEAYHLHEYVSHYPDLGGKLKSMLLSFDKDCSTVGHMRKVARQSGVHPLTVEAFEVLFYNVLDRRNDGLFMSNILYPHTRVVEMDENYLKNSKHADILSRVSYNHRDMDMTAYLAGIGDHSYLSRISAADDRESELAKFIMGNGLLLTHTNLLNQRSVGMQRVSTLLAASRQGGSAVEEPAMSGIQPLFNDAFSLATQVSQESMLEQMRRDEGTVDV